MSKWAKYETSISEPGESTTAVLQSTSITLQTGSNTNGIVIALSVTLIIVFLLLVTVSVLLFYVYFKLSKSKLMKCKISCVNKVISLCDHKTKTSSKESGRQETDPENSTENNDVRYVYEENETDSCDSDTSDSVGEQHRHPEPNNDHNRQQAFTGNTPKVSKNMKKGMGKVESDVNEPLLPTNNNNGAVEGAVQADCGVVRFAGEYSNRGNGTEEFNQLNKELYGEKIQHLNKQSSK